MSIYSEFRNLIVARIIEPSCNRNLPASQRVDSDGHRGKQTQRCSCRPKQGLNKVQKS